jgi:uncharacterized protein YbaA (DUF1428 family)
VVLIRERSLLCVSACFDLSQRTFKRADRKFSQRDSTQGRLPRTCSSDELYGPWCVDIVIKDKLALTTFPGLTGGKMSASDPDSKIDLLDGPDLVKRKIKKAVAAPKIVEENGVLSFVEFVLLPVSALQTGEPRFVVERREGEPLVYSSIEQMHKDYREDIVRHLPLLSMLTHPLTQPFSAVSPNPQARSHRRLEQTSRTYSSRL